MLQLMAERFQNATNVAKELRGRTPSSGMGRPFHQNGPLGSGGLGRPARGGAGLIEALNGFD